MKVGNQEPKLKSLIWVETVHLEAPYKETGSLGILPLSPERLCEHPETNSAAGLLPGSGTPELWELSCCSLLETLTLRQVSAFGYGQAWVGTSALLLGSSLNLI